MILSLMTIVQAAPAWDADGRIISSILVVIAMALLVYLNIRARRLFDRLLADYKKAIEEFDEAQEAHRDVYIELLQEYNEVVRKHNGLLVENREILALSVRVLAEEATGPLQEQLRSMVDQIERKTDD